MENHVKKPLPFRGVGTALVTPFQSDGALDLDAFRASIHRQIKAGVHALIVNGTTGEAPTLRDAEKERLLAVAAEENGGRLPLLAGTGCADTARAVEASRYAAAHGADALLVVTPYYNKGTEQGLLRHYLSIAEAVDCPVVLYNVPSRTGVSLSLPLLSRLAEHQNIVAIKEASGDISRCADIIAALGEKLALYSGNDGDLLPTLALGGAGVISVLSNLLPEAPVTLLSLFEEGRHKEAAALSARLLPLVRLLFAETNPAPVKCAMAELGYLAPVARLPLTMPSEGTARALLQELKKWY